MKVLVCGGRNFDDRNYLYGVLDTVKELVGDVFVINGAAHGADKLSTEWAVSRFSEFKEYPADWKLHGNAAGPIRNRLMYDTELPDVVVAFSGGSGTADMVSYARSKKCKRIIDLRK